MKGGSFPVFLADDRGKYKRKENPVARAKRSLKLQHHVQFIFLNFPGGTPGNSWWGVLPRSPNPDRISRGHSLI